ncbi:hypothetical protein FGRMN_6360 [Fusarium graminum]|nr:hypothetical protein FGRMN_6360 [Fusarium graminum]
MDERITPRLTALPVEVLEIITSYLPNSDIKNLRLVSTLGFSLRLRIERVYLSANLLNIRVLKDIADSGIYRCRVTELIWDDTYLWDTDIKKDKLCYDNKRGVPEWYVHYSSWHSYQLDERSKSPDLEAQKLSWEESYAYYLYLWRQQQLVLSSDIDFLAFSYALKRFPCLHKLTISTRAHGCLFEPFHQTPMIRAFPDGFIYPGYYYLQEHQTAAYLRQGDTDRSETECTTQRRGFAAALQMLSEDGDHKISELFIEQFVECDSSINRDLESIGHTRVNFISLLKRPEFRTLSLHLQRECKCLGCRRYRCGSMGDFKRIFPGSPESWSWETSLSRDGNEFRSTVSKTMLCTSVEEEAVHKVPDKV